jgi:SPP1 gp7 family putative phage head morphogenesis protein
MRKLRAPSVKPIVLGPVFPNAGIEAWYEALLSSLINDASAKLSQAVTVAWGKTPPVFPNSHITAYYGDAAILPAFDAEAAGILFRSGDRLLLMNRADGQGWAFPGGVIELDETAEAAARREAFEETLYPYAGPLEYLHRHEWQNIRFATFTAEVPEPFKIQLNPEHTEVRWVSMEQARRMRLHPGVRATLRAMRGMVVHDAPSPTKALQTALLKWGTATIRRFDLMAQKIATDFASRNQQATQASVLAQLKKAGFTVVFKPTRESIEAYRIVVAENVGLIRSIPRKYHEAVEQKVWNAVRTGSDLHKLSVELREAHGSTIKRAALIARDQNAKAKATIERVRQMELGINRGIWMHSHAGKEPRPTHVAMNGKPYDLSKGMWDSDEQEWVHPGQLINCRCTMRPVIEGFED